MNQTYSGLAITFASLSTRSRCLANAIHVCKNPQDIKKQRRFKRGEIRKQAETLKSSRLWTAGKQVTSE